MKIQRKWRRAWQRGKRKYYIMGSRRRKLQVLPTLGKIQPRVHRNPYARWAATAAATVVLATANYNGATLLAAPPVSDAVNNIHTDGRTATSFAITGNVNNITTSTMAGVNALNSFTKFNIANGNVVNLHVPTGATNLINLVSGGQSQINGMLNSVKDNKIGGNLFFLNPSGVVVGASGSINTGSLALYTPTQPFVDNFFVDAGLSAGQVAAGTLPISSSGLITIEGTVNTINGVKLASGGTAISADGVVNIGAVLSANSTFDNVVNTNAWNRGGDTPTAIATNQDGSIEIVAGNLVNDGTIYSGGAKNFSVAIAKPLDKLTNNNLINLSKSWIISYPASQLVNAGQIEGGGIALDGKTATTISVNSVGGKEVTEIRTSAVNADNALNSFAQFNIFADKLVNLYVPDGANNLINLVGGMNAPAINGTVNTIKADKIGGHGYFLHPSGMRIGEQGSINTGSLTVYTPHPEFVGNFFDDSTGNTAKVLSVNFPDYGFSTGFHSDGLVIIDGTVNAMRDITFGVGAVALIEPTGVINLGAKFDTTGSQPGLFDNVVNSNRWGAAVNPLLMRTASCW